MCVVQCVLRAARPSEPGVARTRSPAGQRDGLRDYRKVDFMLYTIAVVLLVLWLLGLVTSTTMGGLVHVLLVIAIVMILVNFISGRRTL
jgi:Family of unknown function (DUF5670)